MTTAESIEHFRSYFERELRNIGRLVVERVAGVDESEGSAFRYRTVLYLTALDTWAGIRYEGSNYKNHERFKAFVLEHGSWAEAELVSLPLLAGALERRNRLNSVLGQRVSAKLAQFPTGDNGFLRASAMDEPAADLLAYATSKCDREAVERSRHVELLYRYRNMVVHESREPGYGMPVTDSADAHYTAYIGDPIWYLAYPLQMFVGLASRSLASFRQWLMANAVDPYSLVKGTERF